MVYGLAARSVASVQFNGCRFLTVPDEFAPGEARWVKSLQLGWTRDLQHLQYQSLRLNMTLLNSNNPKMRSGPGDRRFEPSRPNFSSSRRVPALTRCGSRALRIPLPGPRGYRKREAGQPVVPCRARITPHLRFHHGPLVIPGVLRLPQRRPWACRAAKDSPAQPVSPMRTTESASGALTAHLGVF